MAAATIALAGNPNSGKTTLFNALTGAHQHVGNYPGVTVEKKEGIYLDGDRSTMLVDLPGTYSLTAYSLEEVVARDFLVNEKPAGVINIVDASNLERNLYLTVQFLELGVPLCIALNMMDMAQKRGIEIDTKKLSSLLGAPVVPTVARTGMGKSELMAAATGLTPGIGKNALVISYGEDLDQALALMEAQIRTETFLTDIYPARWVALKYLEKDAQVLEQGQKRDPQLSEQLQQRVAQVSSHLRETLNTYPEAMIADYRYGYINSLLRQGIVQYHSTEDRLYLSDRIDRVVTHRFLGPILMMGIVLGLYLFTFTASQAPVAWFQKLFGVLGDFAAARLPEGLLRSLVVSGIIDGVGGVMGFVPLIMFMFFGIAALEDSGYLARVAFMLDRVFSIFGLHGSSVMPFIISGGIAGGCAVPGVLAARTLKSPKERLATLLTVPFMNCGAKLPVLALLTGAFFAAHQTGVMFFLTLLAWAGAMLVAKLLRTTVIRGESTPFVMELPPYRLPTLKGLLIHTWERTWQYIRKAGTVILGISILLWALMTFPGLPDAQRHDFDLQRQAVVTASKGMVVENEDAGVLPTASHDIQKRIHAIDAAQAQARLKQSYAGRMGTALETITRWAGFDWRVNIALVGGFAAKEVIVSTMATAYSMGAGTDEKSSMAQTLARSPGWSPLMAMSLIIFVMFYSPCLVTVVCIVRETGSWRWGIFSMVFNTTLALLLATAVYQIGSMGGLG
jgi:ferrous iron transport protein B